MIRKDGTPKVSNLDALTGIACIKYRGSDLGAGFALFDPDLSSGGQTHKIKAFVRNQGIADNLAGPALGLRELPARRPAPHARAR